MEFQFEKYNLTKEKYEKVLETHDITEAEGKYYINEKGNSKKFRLIGQDEIKGLSKEEIVKISKKIPIRVTEVTKEMIRQAIDEGKEGFQVKTLEDSHIDKPRIITMEWFNQPKFQDGIFLYTNMKYNEKEKTFQENMVNYSCKSGSLNEDGRVRSEKRVDCYINSLENLKSQNYEQGKDGLHRKPPAQFTDAVKMQEPFAVFVSWDDAPYMGLENDYLMIYKPDGTDLNSLKYENVGKGESFGYEEHSRIEAKELKISTMKKLQKEAKTEKELEM